MFKYQSKLVLLLLVLCASVNLAHAAQPVDVRALVGSNNVTMGEVFILQIQVDGSSDVAEPDLTGIKDFSCAYVGGAPSNSVFYSNINGVSKKEVKNSYIFNYKLSPVREGVFTIPSLTLRVDNTDYFTDPITITVGSQQSGDDSFLRYRIARNTYYLGETFPLELVWYFRNNATLTGIEVPAFLDDRFIVAKPPAAAAGAANSRAFEMNINGSRYLGLQSQDVVNGVAYNTLTLKVYLTPKAVGKLELKPSSIMSQVVVGYKESAGRSPFSGAFDDFFGHDPFNRKQPIVKEFAVTTPETEINVLPLPAGSPENYTGIVSQVKIADKADVTEASVGEPINVTVMVAGNDNLFNLKLPDYNNQQNIRGKFKVTADSTGGKIYDKARVFNLVFRALDDKVSEIPSLELSYFDVNDKEYKTAASDPVKIKINAAKIVTASDIEAATDYSAAADDSRQKNSPVNGILYNYTDDSVLVDYSIRFTGWVNDNRIFLAGLPCSYFSLILLQFFLKRRKSTVKVRKSNKAMSEFDRVLKGYQKNGITAENLTEGLLLYFKNKLNIYDREITLTEVFNDFLADKDFDGNTSDNIKKIFDYCDACTYSGAASTKLSADFVNNVRIVVAGIDKQIR